MVGKLIGNSKTLALAFAGLFYAVNPLAMPGEKTIFSYLEMTFRGMPVQLVSFYGLSFLGTESYIQKENTMKELQLFNHPVRVNDEGVICMTDMWQIAKLRTELGDDKFLCERKINSIRPSQFAHFKSKVCLSNS